MLTNEITMKKRALLIARSMFLLLFTMCFTLTGFAQKPDFSGTWTLNESKSKLGAEFSMAPGTYIITQEGNRMESETIADFQGQEFRQKNNYTLDGSESKNEGFQGMEQVSIANWTGDGNFLQIKTSIEMMDGGELVITRTFGMDGENLVVENSMQGGPMGGSNAETWVYDRE